MFELKFSTVYQLLAHGRWFSPGTPAIAEILLKLALSTIKLINQLLFSVHLYD
jgi:hypothetical protein